VREAAAREPSTPFGVFFPSFSFLFDPPHPMEILFLLALL
jgi:hypothetical protein